MEDTGSLTQKHIFWRKKKETKGEHIYTWLIIMTGICLFANMTNINKKINTYNDHQE